MSAGRRSVRRLPVATPLTDPGFAAEVERSVTLRRAFGFSRLAVAFACAVALVFRFLWGLGTATFTASNFFAYLTIQSNIVFVVVWALAGASAIRYAVDPPWLATLRAVVLSCTVSAGIVFAVLIQQAGQRDFRIDVPWSDLLLHFYLPALALADWVAAPGRGRCLWRALPYVLGYLVLWGGLTLARGAVVGWYPYFFLDPVQVSGVPEFLLLSGVALVLFTVVTGGLVAVGRTRPLAGPKGRQLPR